VHDFELSHSQRFGTETVIYSFRRRTQHHRPELQAEGSLRRDAKL
jgi:hypothetical protein